MTLLEMVERSQIRTGNHAVVIHCMYVDTSADCKLVMFSAIQHTIPYSRSVVFANAIRNEMVPPCRTMI